MLTTRVWGSRFGRPAVVALVTLSGLAMVLLVFSPGRSESPQATNERPGRLGIVDPNIGHVPRPDVSADNVRESPSSPQFNLRIDQDGIRSNGHPPPAIERPLTLVVGDSFAFGDDVDDGDSWPAQLENILNRRVVNGGIPSFGFDQMELWAERLSSRFKPQVIVAAFIPHDVLRCEFSAWPAGEKPYFDVDDDGQLRFHPIPPPDPAAVATEANGPTNGIRPRMRSRGFGSGLREVLAANPTLDRFLSKQVHWAGPIVHAHRRGGGSEVACLLIARFAELGRQYGARVIIVGYPERPVLMQSENTWIERAMQWGRAYSIEDEMRIKDSLLQCAERNALEVLDLFPVFQRLSLEARRALYNDHFTPAGNALVAGEVAAFIAADHHPTRGK
jgi:hypothetical protein